MPPTRSRWLVSAWVLVCLAGAAFHGRSQQSGVTYTWPGLYSFRDGADVNLHWKCMWLGYGTGRVASGQLWLTPAISTSPGETHSALVRSNFALPSSYNVTAVVATDKQLRTAKPHKKGAAGPNAWEVAWLVVNMADDGSAGIYFMLKPNGVELGAYARGGSEYIYLFTNASPRLVLGQNYTYSMINDGRTLTVLIDGLPVAAASLASLYGWVLGDRIGLYTEDAAVRFGPVTVSAYP